MRRRTRGASSSSSASPAPALAGTTRSGTRRAGSGPSRRSLTVGVASVPFLDYFAGLAAQTGAGHPHRDAYASLARWNLPASEV